MTYSTFASPGRPPAQPFGTGPSFGPPGVVGGRRPRPVLISLAVGVLLGFVELFVLMAIGQRIGPLATILLMIATSALGVWFLRREGPKSWRAFRSSVQERRPPGPAATEGLLVLIGGGLMVLPGFVSDLLGALLVIPPTRRLAARFAQSALARRLTPSAATSLFGPRTVRVRTGAPRHTPPAEPAPSGSTDPIEGELIDPQ
jgi:UPF0716 protein FxsA